MAMEQRPGTEAAEILSGLWISPELEESGTFSLFITTIANRLNDLGQVSADPELVVTQAQYVLNHWQEATRPQGGAVTDEAVSGPPPSRNELLQVWFDFYELIDEVKDSEFLRATKQHLDGLGLTSKAAIAYMEYEPGELITHDLTTIDEIRRAIIDDARKRVLAFDWASLGCEPGMVATVFDLMYPLALRQKKFAVPESVNMASEVLAEDRSVLDELPGHQMTRINDEWWLVQLEPEVTAHEAQALHDYLIFMVPELMAKQLRIELSQVAERFLTNNDMTSRAGLRLDAYLHRRPLKNPLAFAQP